MNFLEEILSLSKSNKDTSIGIPQIFLTSKGYLGTILIESPTGLVRTSKECKEGCLQEKKYLALSTTYCVVISKSNGEFTCSDLPTNAKGVISVMESKRIG